MSDQGEKKTRREVLKEGVRLGGLITISATLGSFASRASAEGTVWQIDPYLCTQCGKCATECVLETSAAKCVHAYALCGYCQLCFGLYRDQRTGNAISAENNRCPTDAIRRNFIEDPYYEMSIDESLCIGCAKCVKGCNQFGNGSMHLQIRHDRCVNCNQCAIAQHCPAGAIKRVPASQPYLFKTVKK